KVTSYLILRAIQTLTHPINPRHASDWLCNLIVADSGDWTTEGLGGGAYEKVIYWAFQKQGLFGGSTPDVDVFIDNGRGGEYQCIADERNCRAIGNRLADDGLEAHQNPVPNVVNYAYVKIKNRGLKTAQGVVVNAFRNRQQLGLIFPDGWEPMTPAQIPGADLPPNSPEVKIGPFAWTPTAGENYILMAVSASGDLSNLVKFEGGKSIPDWRLVPYDNNLGMRKV